MTKAYKLADGSLSSDYAKGDTFRIHAEGCKPDLVACTGHDGEWCLTDTFYGFAVGSVKWCILTPTPETKRKMEERKHPAEVLREFAECTAKSLGMEVDHELIDKAKAFMDEEIEIQPLARIVDWCGLDDVKRGDVVITMHKNYIASGNEGSVNHDADIHTTNEVWVLRENIIAVIRINTDALPKQRTLTRAEAEKEFGVRIAGD